MWCYLVMTLEDLADLIRANSANLNRSAEQMHAQSYGQLLNLQNDMTDLRADVVKLKTDVADAKATITEVKRNLDLAETVSLMRHQIDRLETEVEALKRRA